MKLLTMLSPLKSGMKSKPILTLLVITSVSIILNKCQLDSNKKQLAELKLKKSQLSQCQLTNDLNALNVVDIGKELNACVGTRKLLKEKLTAAELDLDYFTTARERDLNERIERIESLPAQECDSVAVDSDVVGLWREKTNN